MVYGYIWYANYIIVIGATLTEPHTSGTALQDTYVCLLICAHIPKIE